MADEKLEQLQAHVDACAVCSAANKRVNDFCEAGRLLFSEWAKHHEPIRITEHTLPQDQYDRLVAETRRRERQRERN